MKSTQSHLRSWVTLLPFWPLHMIIKTSRNYFKRKMAKMRILYPQKMHKSKTQVQNDHQPLKPQMGQAYFHSDPLRA